MERNKILSKYDHIFIKEQEYYKKEKISSSRDFDLENENFFRLSYLKFKILLGNVKNKKILDVGCGNGALSFYLTRKGAEVIDPGIRIVLYRCLFSSCWSTTDRHSYRYNYCHCYRGS